MSTERVRNLVWAAILVWVPIALATACSGADAAGEVGASDDALGLPATPEYPALARDVAQVQKGQLRAPAIPAHRTSNDGRIALALKGDDAGNRGLYLFAPERLTAHFWESTGAAILSTTTPLALPEANLYFPSSGVLSQTLSHSTLCDGTTMFDGGGAAPQPHACGDDDCYDLTIISTVVTQVDANHSRTQLWGTPIRVTVKNPKTALASLGSVTHTGRPVGGPVFDGVNSFLEPMVTRDGHLLVGRVSHSLHDPVTNATLDIVYAMHDKDAAGRLPAACDVTAWKELRAITRAPSDARVNTTYGFARYPFRDATGTALEVGSNLPGTYPWIDRDGRNIFFTTMNARLFYKRSGVYGSRYPTRCPAGVRGCDATLEGGFAAENQGNTRGPTVMGLWTHGRAVMMDGRISNTDYGLGVPDATQREIQLYADGTGPTGKESGWVRVGVGRDNGVLGVPAGMPRNTTFIESIENLFQHAARMRPRTPRDVVWFLDTRLTTEEIAFDDWLDPRAIIVSDMVPTFGRDGYDDGFDFSSGSFAPSAPLRMQNAATAPPDVRAVPAYGHVEGAGRAEPVAMGGIVGRGLWLQGASRLVYDVPGQPATDDAHWISLFVDARLPATANERRLLTFPDGTALTLDGNGTVLRGRDTGGTEAFAVTLPEALALRGRKYRHVGLRVKGHGTSVELFVDGFRLHGATIPAPGIFRFPAGPFVVGSTSSLPGVRGWIDEVRVLAETVEVKVACNHARGTLQGLDAQAPADLVALANLYPSASHSAISAKLAAHGRATFPRYVCRHDYTSLVPPDLEATAGVTSLRSDLLFPEGPLHFGQPRPDSSHNPFCLSCHVNGQPPSLSVSALVPRAVLMENDRRRQPLQSPRLLFGWVPAGYAAGLPQARSAAPGTGDLLDRWLLR